MEKLKIEPGKFYRLRNGMKYRCYAVEGGGISPVHGAYFDADRWEIVCHTPTGSNTQYGNYDIISEWVDELDFDASCLPAWANKFIAMDESGYWFCFPEKPFCSKGEWRGRDALNILKEYAPKNYSGNWQDSLHEIKDGKAVKYSPKTKEERKDD